MPTADPKPHKILFLKSTDTFQVDAEKGAGGLPQRMQVLKWGVNNTSKGPVIVNETTLAELPRQHKALNWDVIALDFEHNSVPGSPAYKGEPCSIAGYNQPEIVTGQGAFIQMNSWTADGEKFALGGHYRDLSATVVLNDKSEVIAIHSVALCRMGATEDIVFLSAPDLGSLVKLLSATATATTPDKTDMDPKPPQNDAELVIALKTLLGLGADTQPADVLTAFSAKLKAEPEKKTEEAAGDTKMLSASVEKLTKLLGEHGEQIKLLSASHESNERANVLAMAAREGKEVPKSAAEKMPLADLKTLCAELPVTVPMERRTVDATALMLSSSQPGEIKEDSVSQLTGVSAEDRKKYGGN